jgi:predicted lipid-binding transport protein (Tim44 family)
MAYEQGTSTTTTQGTGTAQSIGSSTQGGFGVAHHNIQTSSTSTTRTPFAQRAAPPNNWIAAPLVLLLMLGGIYGILLMGTLPPQNWLLLLMTLPAYWLYRLIRSPKYREARAQWEKSWICAACGNIFVPSNNQ